MKVFDQMTLNNLINLYITVVIILYIITILIGYYFINKYVK